MSMRGFIYGSVFSIFACMLISHTVEATQGDSMWPKTGTYTVTQTSSIDYDSIKLCTQQSIKTIYLLNYPTSTSDSCVHETAYGSYTDSGYIKRFVGDYVQVTTSVIPVPNTDKMYARVCGYPCRLVYYDTTQGFSASTSGYGYRLTPRASPLPVSNPVNNAALEVYSIGYSANGKWIVIETYGGFVRYNTETGEFLKFSNSRGSYGVGQDPSFKYSITDDGRYIVLSGNNYRYATVFDLATCTGGSTTNPVGILATCESVELLGSVQKNGYQVSGLYGAAFRAGGREIVAYGPDSNNKTMGYIIRLDSLETRADYVALGDSFSSGEGDIRDNTHYLPGTDGTSEFPDEKCHISNRSYPYLLQQQNSSQLSFSKGFACSGATSQDIIGSPDNFIGQFKQLDNIGDLVMKAAFRSDSFASDTPGRIPQYRFLEKYQPKSMTITIGGNDAGFGNVLSACVTAGTCEFESLDRAAKGLEMASKYQVLRDTYRKLLNASSDAKLYVLSYPQFIDDNNQCNPNVGMNGAERIFVRQSVSYFNQVIRQAALAEGASYIDVADSLKGEALCSSKLLSLAVNGIVGGNDKYNIIGQESFHPNAHGHELMATYIKDNYGLLPNLSGETCPVTSCSDYRAPALPGYFNVLPTTVQRYKSAMIAQAKAAYTLASNISIKLKNFMPNAVGYLSIHSTPQPLGIIIADASGEFSATVTLPAAIEPGYHELHLETKTLDGTKISYYQSLTIIASEEDVDGDGVPNSEDACNFVEAKQLDADNDTIDDGCDGDIYSPPTLAVMPSAPEKPAILSSFVQPSQPSSEVPPGATATLANPANETTNPVIDEMTYGKVAGISVDNSEAVKKPEPTQSSTEQKSPSKVVFGVVVVIVMALIATVLFMTLRRT